MFSANSEESHAFCSIMINWLQILYVCLKSSRPRSFYLILFKLKISTKFSFQNHSKGSAGKALTSCAMADKHQMLLLKILRWSVEIEIKFSCCQYIELPRHWQSLVKLFLSKLPWKYISTNQWDILLYLYIFCIYSFFCQCL